MSMAQVAINRSAEDRKTVTMGYDPSTVEELERMGKIVSIDKTRAVISGHKFGLGKWTVEVILPGVNR